ncbi:MAG: glycine--tRNA ligase subunit beta [Peptococcaceae bacterium]|nr:glycine--tRNA ligase subunit beta [Peptococcaceae bacterium]
MAKDFLLEIGVEEMPARFLPGGLDNLVQIGRDLLEEYRLSYRTLKSYGTPRRLALYVEGLSEEQEPLVQEIKGPPKKAAFDVDGNPTKAAIGFARSKGVAVEDLVSRVVGKIEYVFAVKKEPGRPTSEILRELAPRLITSLPFPKPMRWGDYDLKFARPIRWLVALFDGEVIPFSLAGVESGPYTFGHRFLSRGKLKIQSPRDYIDLLREHYVLADPQERYQKVWQQVQETAQTVGGQVRKDEELLEEVVNLLEYPTAFCGSFPAKYLAVPAEVLVTSMREHQRYFPVYDVEGRLLPNFIAVHNGTAEHLATIRAGNEKVLNARLADAEFFWKEDLAKPLASRVDELKKVVFHEELGTIYDKIQRLKAVAGCLAEALDLSPEARQHALRAAELCKADLVTDMVYEFPELQGVMGAEYARRTGEEEGVARAIFEHYLPRFAGDELPASAPGIVLSLAERWDNLVGFFGLGIQPTGSQDPYALRRQALGVCHILMAHDLHLPLDEMVARAYEQYQGRLPVGLTEVTTNISAFFKQRLRGLFAERGLSHDVIDAVLAVGFQDVPDAWARGQALARFRGSPGFEDLYTAFTRANNLAQKAVTGEVRRAYLEDESEVLLYNALQDLKQRVEPVLKNDRSYLEALAVMGELRPHIDRFFDDVMVMADDERVRNNRLALLYQISSLVKQVADLSRLVVS